VTLRLRMAVVATVLLAVLTVAGFLVVHTVDSYQLQQVDQKLASVVPAAFRLALGTRRGAVEPPRASATENAFSDVYVATISGGARHLVLSPSSSGHGSPDVPGTVSGAGLLALHPSTVRSQSGPGDWRAVLVRPPRSSVVVLIGVSLAGAEATGRQLRLAVLGAAALVVIVLAAAGLWVTRLGLRPIAEVTEVADAIAAGDRSRRVAVRGSRTEAAHLAQAFNFMLDEQQALEARLRRFVADASHELRSPVTAIQGFAELWRRGSVREGPALEQSMRRIGQESARMARLVEDLVLLARLDEGRPLRRERVDMVMVVHDAVVDARAAHPSRLLDVAEHGPVVVDGDADALRQVVGNLVGNALAHTQAPVTVAVDVQAGAARLVVSDTGPGMSADSAAHAFDRFWQADPGRTGSGSGLGLSIVAAIVAAHKGSASIASEPGLGTKVMVTLPLKATG
jgi:two-component system OmpR family sensor kinase